MSCNDLDIYFLNGMLCIKFWQREKIQVFKQDMLCITSIMLNMFIIFYNPVHMALEFKKNIK